MAGATLRIIKPTSFDLVAPFNSAIDGVIRRVGSLILQDFRSTVDGWKDAVEFVLSTTRDGITCTTTDPIYGYVNDGTRPHIINARNAPALRFSTGYSPKTRPGYIGSKGSGTASGPTVFAQSVNHPGTEGRHFDLLIQQRRQVTMEQQMRQAMAVAARKVGK